MSTPQPATPQPAAPQPAAPQPATTESIPPEPAATRPAATRPAATRPATTQLTTPETATVGMTVTHRRYVPYSHAHYAGNLVDGAYSLAAFGDVATELCIRTDGDEGLFASYSDVQFRAPVRAGDCIEIAATLVRVGSRSREMTFEVTVTARGNLAGRGSSASLLAEPIVATTARGVVVVPATTAIA